MSDVVYSVEVQFLQSGNLGAGLGSAFSSMHTKIDEVEKHFHLAGMGFGKGLDSALSTVGSALIGAVEGAAVTAGGLLTTALAASLKQGLSFESYKESARIGLAAIQSMLADTPFDVGMGNAEKSVEHLRKLSMTMPTTLKDLMGTFQSVLPAGLQSALPLDRLESFAAKITVAGAALGLNSKMVGHEAAALLEGRARSSMPLATRLGIHASEWNKLDASTRFHKLESLVGKTDPALEAYRTSMMGITTTAKDYGMQFASVFAAPLFGSIKSEGLKALDYIGKNEDSINAMLTSMGVGVDAAFHRGLDLAKHWIPIAEQFGTTLYHSIVSGLAVVDPYLRRAGDMLEHFAKDPNAVHKLGSAGLAFAGMKAGTSTMSMGGDLLGDVAKFGPLLASAGVGMGEIAAASGVGALALAALGLGTYGAIDILTDTTSRWHDGAIESIEHVKKNATKMGEAADRAAPALRSVADAIGAYWIKGLEFWSYVLAEASTEVSNKLATLSQAADLASAAFGRLIKINEPIDPARQPQEVRAMLPFIDAMADAQERADAKRKIPTHVTNVHAGAIQVRVEGSQDPNRVAKLTADIVMKKLGRATGYSDHAGSRLGIAP